MAQDATPSTIRDSQDPDPSNRVGTKEQLPFREKAESLFIPTRIDPSSLSMVPILEERDDWLTWEQKLKNCVLMNGLDNVLDGEPPKPPTTENPTVDELKYHHKATYKWSRCEALVEQLLTNRISDSNLERIREIEGVKAKFHRLKEHNSSAGDDIFTRLELCSVTYDDCKGIDDLDLKLRKAFNKVAQLNTAGYKMKLDEHWKIYCLLKALGPKWSDWEQNFIQNHLAQEST